MAKVQGARARAREEVMGAVAAEARAQLATEGAAGLSLRAVARSLGMVSSGIYRYVASRDALLTLLIVESYDALGEATERAAAKAATAPPAERLLAVSRAIRRWAVAHPHEWALLYGSPVPGYQAPEDTIAPAARVSLALVSVVADAHAAGQVQPVPAGGRPLPRGLAKDAAALRATLEIDLPDELVVRMLAAWSQIFGLVSFEIFGQTRNVIHDHAALLDATTEQMAALLGLDGRG
jgi:AcrR family transcriptional regulator